MTTDQASGSPFAPHTADETATMLDAIGVESQEDLFDIPSDVQFDGEFGIHARDEQTTRRDLARILGRNTEVISFLGRGHYQHYVPSVVNHLSDRSEFLTSYTQYQPEVAQGFLQVLFEYQSMIVELTGLGVANCSLYDGATAIAEAALLAGRLRDVSGSRVLVPELLRESDRSVLENYTIGAGLTVEEYSMRDGNVDVDALAEQVDADVAMVYVESPNVIGAIEEALPRVATIAHEHEAVCCLGTDPIALGVLAEPASVGIDIVVGDASVLGLPASYGMGLGLFACREDYLRRVPGRLVGASRDTRGNRAYTLTLQTREQHIRRERATSNICTNQAWVALRTAMHLAALGPDGLIELASQCVEYPRDLAAQFDSISGVRAPVFDRHYFREFIAHTDQPAAAIARDLVTDGFVVHPVRDQWIQVCVTEVNAHAMDDLVLALEGVA